MNNKPNKFVSFLAGLVASVTVGFSLIVATLVVWGLIELILWIGRH